MRVVLLSCYELGHAPHGLAMPAAFLARAGYEPEVRDLAHQPLDEPLIAAADFVGISVPMHTALRLGALVGRRVRELNARCHLCFFGLYAPLHADYLASIGADSVLGGEHEEQLVALVESRQATRAIALDRLEFPTPRRVGLPTLDRYARLATHGREHVAGYTEASRGCLYACRHCPIPSVYGRRFFVVDRDTVLADVAAQVEAGAEHITFGDPDFFNGPRHAMAVLRAVHERWPRLTFDITVKVEHLLREAHRMAELVELGCAFVVSAVETVDDEVLARLDKGHTRADVERVLSLARAAGLAVRPTFVPFTPWTRLEGLVDLVELIDREDLIDAVDPVQLSVRLLVPPGSLLLASEPPGTFGALDPAALTHVWRHADPRVDALQRELAALAERNAGYDELRAAVYRAVGRAAPSLPSRAPRAVAPRLTEHWFC